MQKTETILSEKHISLLLKVSNVFYVSLKMILQTLLLSILPNCLNESLKFTISGHKVTKYQGIVDTK